MPTTVKLIPVSRCRPDAGTFVEHGGRELAVFLIDGGDVTVIDNTCPHSGGNLSAGQVCGGVVTCPLHEWRFRLDTGACVESPKARVNTYPARIEDGWVWIEKSTGV